MLSPLEDIFREFFGFFFENGAVAPRTLSSATVSYCDAPPATVVYPQASTWELEMSLLE
jgi:hypothetical protein